MHCSRVLAAVDSSKPTSAVFECALALSRRHGARLVAVEAVPPAQVSGHHAHRRRAFTAALRRKTVEAGIELEYRVHKGDPVDIVLSHARTVRPDVILVSTHEGRGTGGARVTSAAERIMAKSTVPVLLVPPHLRQKPGRAFSHVAVAVAFGPTSRGVVEHALTWADGPQDRLTLFHAVRDYASSAFFDAPRPGLVTCQDQLMRRDQDRLMRDALARLELAVPRDRLAVVDAQVVLGNTAAAIVRAAEESGADLLVAGVPRRNAISRALFGLTAAPLLAATPIPLLTVPAAPMTVPVKEDRALRMAA